MGIVKSHLVQSLIETKMKNWKIMGHNLRKKLRSCASTIFPVVLQMTMTLSPNINHSHKKRKNSLVGGLDRVLFVTELDLPKILVPRLPWYTPNVNTECTGKSEWSKQLYYLYVTSFLEHWYILILLFWYQSVFNWWILV